MTVGFFTRRGLLVPLFFALGIALAEIADSSVLHGRLKAWPHFLFLSIGGIALWRLDGYYRTHDTWVDTDPKTGEERVMTRVHYFGYLRMRNWGILFVLLGLAFLINNPT
jgi:hypothetical protein